MPDAPAHMRMGEDDGDVELLLRQCRITSAEDALRLLHDMYPTLEAPPKTRFFLEEHFQ